MGQDRHAPGGADEADRLRRGQAVAIDITWTPADEETGEGVVDRGRVPGLDQRPRHVRAPDRAAPGDRDDPLVADRRPRRRQPLDDPPGAVLARVAEAGQHLGEGRVRGVDEVAEDVDLAGRDVGAQFDAGDEAQPVLPGRGAGLGQPGGGVVVRQAEDTKPPLGGQSDQPSGGEHPIGSGGMCVQIDLASRALGR